MADYHVDGQQTVTASPGDTTLSIHAGTSGRVKVYDFTSGFTLATPSDNLLTVDAGRVTTTGTAGANPTPLPLDPADVACNAVAGENHSIEPTYTAGEQLFGPVAQHMRATYRWVAAPGKEWVMPATANNGVGWRAIHASATPEHYISAYFSE